jgi:hypothetical protein
MKKFIFIFFTFLIGLGSTAQSFLLDTSFQPFFDIRNQSSVSVSDIYENVSDGRIYFTGNFEVFNGSTPFRGSICYRRNGNLYSNYKSYIGLGSFGYLSRIAIDTFFISDGANAFLIDTLGDTNGTIWRLNYIKSVKCASGAIPFFYPDGSSLFANGSDNTGQPCKIINPPDTFQGRHIVKLTPQSLWDSTFIGIANHQPDGFVKYDSNRILIYGFPWRFTHYNGVQVNGLCRVFLDGTLDTTFHSIFSDTVYNNSFAAQLFDNQGRFFLTGDFYLPGQTQKTTVARFLPNGDLDSTFNFLGSPQDTSSFNAPAVYTIVETEDKGYLIGGFFNEYQGFPKRGIAKIDSTGIVEPQYFTSSGPDSSTLFGDGFPFVGKIIKSKFGGYYVGGDFLKWDGQPSQPIVRITDLVTGLEETLSASTIPQHDKLKVYPNPTTGIFNLQSKSVIEKVAVYNIRGVLILSDTKWFKLRPSIHSETSSEHSGSNLKRIEVPERKIDLTNFPKGIYFIQVTLENGERVNKKLIKL